MGGKAMSRARWLAAGVAALLIAAFLGRDHIGFALDLPKDRNVLFWSVKQRDYAFGHLEMIPSVKSNTMRRSAQVHAFGKGPPLTIQTPDAAAPFDLDAFMASQRAVGLMVVVDNKVRLEQYAMGQTASDRWTSFSVAKSVTSTLLGAAIRDGFIKSVDQPVTDIIPAFKGTAYDGVTIKHILTMTSGVKWNEDYADPGSDVAKFDKVKPVPGEEAIVTYMRGLPREAAPGTKWVYKTGETNLIGAIVMRATKKSLAAYLEEKVWRPYGMESDGFWVLDTTGHEIGGCCISARLGDFARFGQFMLDGGVAGGKPVLPQGWIAQAGQKQAEIGNPARGYGYQWWTYGEGSFAARGLFGQSIFIDPRRAMVIAMNANYPDVHEEALAEARRSFFRAVQQAVDRERGLAGQEAIR
jgi:CubicO group peptidase (beta-lactamase class C family)